MGYPGLATHMPILLRRKLMRIGNSLRVAIPKEIVEILQLKQGDSIEFAATNEHIIIRKARK
jgi:AbrB family looped-hinge helix DNA binding protein